MPGRQSGHQTHLPTVDWVCLYLWALPLCPRQDERARPSPALSVFYSLNQHHRGDSQECAAYVSGSERSLRPHLAAREEGRGEEFGNTLLSQCIVSARGLKCQQSKKGHFQTFMLLRTMHSSWKKITNLYLITNPSKRRKKMLELKINGGHWIRLSPELKVWGRK